MAAKSSIALHVTHDLPPAVREDMIELLNQELADMSDLHSQTKQAHWNVKGPQFMQLHALYDQLAGELVGYVDDLAERAVQLGGLAQGTNRMSASNSRLPELPDITAGLDVTAALVERYGHVAATTRKGIQIAADAGDQDTSDLMTEISRGMDKWVWFLESHLK